MLEQCEEFSTQVAQEELKDAEEFLQQHIELLTEATNALVKDREWRGETLNVWRDKLLDQNIRKPVFDPPRLSLAARKNAMQPTE